MQTWIWEHIVGPSNPEPIKSPNNTEKPNLTNEDIFHTVGSEILIPQIIENENLRQSKELEKNNSQENFQDFESENLIEPAINKETKNQIYEEEKKIENEPKSTLQEESQKENLEKQEIYEISIEEHAKNIKVSFQDGFLDRNTISQIFEKGVEIAKNEYVSMVLMNRKGKKHQNFFFSFFKKKIKFFGKN